MTVEDENRVDVLNTTFTRAHAEGYAAGYAQGQRDALVVPKIWSAVERDARLPKEVAKAIWSLRELHRIHFIEHDERLFPPVIYLEAADLIYSLSAQVEAANARAGKEKT